MSSPLSSLVVFLRAASSGAEIKARRGYGELLADRILQASTEATLFGFGERLLALLQTPAGAIGPEALAAWSQAAGSPQAPALLAWLATQPRLAALLAYTKDEAVVAQAVAAIALPEAGSAGQVHPRRPFLVGLTVTCLTPLAHGADHKAGNATLFRRMTVLSREGQPLSLPFYGGNAVRGLLRDLLAEHLLAELGIADRNALALWFFHALFAGGCLEESGEATKALAKELGDNGADRLAALREFRNLLPGLSLLGCALGNRILSGRLQVGDLRPRCQEWGTADEVPARALTEWQYLTRRDEREEKAEDSAAMIAVTECLKAGTILDGGIDCDLHIQELERAALGQALVLLAARGRLGAENRRDLGSVRIEIENAPAPAPYLDFLHAERGRILAYLAKVKAVKE